MNFTTEKGFTYMELVVSLLLIALLIPIIFTFLYTVSSGAKQMMSKQYLQMNWESFSLHAQREWMMVQQLSLDANQCVWQNSSAEKVRYVWNNQKLIRQVQISGKWRGHMILLFNVKKAKIQCDHNMLKIKVVMSKGDISIPFRFVSRSRVGLSE